MLESALLAQKIAQMTQGMKKDSLRASNGSLAGLAQHLSSGAAALKHKEAKAVQGERASSKTSAANVQHQSQKRKSMKVTSNLSGRGSLNLAHKNQQQ